MTDQFSKPSVGVIADMENTAALLIQRVLEPAGYKAWIASTSKAQPDVLVVDVTQLRGDPMGKLRQVREQGMKSPAIVLAAHFPISKLRDLFLAGVNDFLVKPYRVEELTESIDRLAGAGGDADRVEALQRQIDQARQTLRERSDELSKVNSFGRVIAEGQSPDAILDRAAQAVRRLIGVELAGAYLIDAQGTELILRSGQIEGQEVHLPEHAPLEKSLAGEVFQTHRAILRQPQVATEPIEIQAGFLVYSAALVPLVMDGQTVGVLGAFGTKPETRLNEHHANLLRAVADWCGVAFRFAYITQQAKSTPAHAQVAEPPSTPVEPAASAQAAPAPGGPTAAVSPDLIDGLEGITETLRGMLQRANESGKQALGPLLQELLRIRSLPMVFMNSGEIDRLVDVHTVVEQVASELGDQAALKNLKLSLREPTRLPMWRGDATRLAYCLEALIGGSLDRTQRGEIAVELHRSHFIDEAHTDLPLADYLILHPGWWAAVSIRDTSDGLGEDIHQALIAGQADPAAGKMGPGLTMGEVRMMVESMGGAIWALTPQVGSEVWVAFPLT